MDTEARTSGRLDAVAHIRDDWYIVCESARLGRDPLAAQILGTPIVVFRDGSGRAGALIDRCPHRNAPLSLGKVVDGNLQCAYHGWEFGCDGLCLKVPGLVGAVRSRQLRAESFAVREQDGFVWVYPTADVEPARDPFRLPYAGNREYVTERREVRARASLHATAENALDVPHTAYLHGGIFRSADRKRNDIDVVVRRWHDRVEAEYVGEPRPPGLLARFLAPGGGTVQHFDRFYLPSVVEVEYRLGDKYHICVTAPMTPVDDYDTRMFAVISYKLPFPRALVNLGLGYFGMKVFRQDADMLEKQTAAISRFGGERYKSTELDVLGADILKLLRLAESGERDPVDEPAVRRTVMRV